MESVEISKSRSDVVFAVIALPFAVLIAVAMIALGIYGLIQYSRGELDPSVEAFIGLVVMTVFGSLICASGYIEVKYRRSLWWTRYVLDSQGIVIGHVPAEHRLSWHDVDSAAYSRLFNTIRLKSKTLPEPLVFAIPRDERAPDGSMGRAPFIMRLLESKMGGRFHRRWLP